MAVQAAFCYIQNIFFLSISSPQLWGQLPLHLNVCVFVRMHVGAGESSIHSASVEVSSMPYALWLAAQIMPAG